MDAATLYTLLVCTGTSVPCERPFGWAPSFDREECIWQMYAIRFSDPDKRVICLQPSRMGEGFSSPPGDIIDSASRRNEPDWIDGLDVLGQPGQK